MVSSVNSCHFILCCSIYCDNSHSITLWLLLPPWQRRLCFWWGWFVCLSVDNITQKVMNGLGWLYNEELIKFW